MTVDIKPIDCYIEESFLTKQDSDDILKCKIIGIQAYKNAFPTLQILIEDSYLFSDIPIEMVFHRKDVKPDNMMHQHKKCPSYKIEVFYHSIFKNRKISFLNVLKGKFMAGEYLLSFDFYTDNEMLHLIKGDDGLFYISPNHKINWSAKEYLPNFKKI
jgi:hypothetical protein